MYKLFYLILVLSFHSYAITFNYYGDKNDSVFVMSDLNKWGQIPWPMQHKFEGHFSFSIPSPFAHLVRYKFLVNNRWTHDPFNSYVENDGVGGFNSVIKTNFRESDLLVQSEYTPNWKLDKIIFNFRGVNREVFYIHPGFSFDFAKREVITVYFHDGLDYLDIANVKTLLENLSLDKSLPIFRAILIPPRNREEEYTFDDDYALFVAQNLVNYFEPEYSTLSVGVKDIRSKKRLIMGASLGGLSSFYISLRYPEVFPNVAGQSSSFWYLDEKIVKLYNRSKVLPKNVYFSWGTFESLDIKKSNMNMKNLLQAKNIQIYTKTHPASHNWLYWRNSLEQILRYFAK